MIRDYFLGLSEEGFHKVAYTEWGSPKNKQTPIICLHGMTRNGRDFDALANHLSLHGRHIYCPDLPGRGDSDWLQNPAHYTYELYIQDMNTLIAHTCAKQVDWVGTSLGGILGMILASKENTPIRRLILNDVGPQIPASGLSKLGKYIGKRSNFDSIEQAKTYFKNTYREFSINTEEDWDHFTKHSISQMDDGHYQLRFDNRINLSSAKSKIAWDMLMHPIKALEGSWFDVDLWSTWKKVRCPVLILHGADSSILTSSIIDKMKALHPETESITFEGVGHAPALLSKNEQEMIDHWLRK